MSRTVIAVDLDTMRELADEETRVRSEKTDWREAAYREEAVRRVEERRETQKMLEVWEARRLARPTASPRRTANPHQGGPTTRRGLPPNNP